jgi:hypothetical protein
MKRIIGITGHARHGKNTVGDVLATELNYEPHAFADSLRSMALAVNPRVVGDTRLTDVVRLEGWEGAKRYDEVRRFLQVLGTEGVRDHLGEDAWVRAMEERLNGKLDDGKTRIVITDVRFPNEAEWVKQVGGDVWRVVRLNYDNGVAKDHPSEAMVDSLIADRRIVAETLDELYEEVRKAVKSYARD